MTKKLLKIGNSYAVVLNRSMLTLLGITPETELTLTTDGKQIMVGPLKPQDPKQRMNEAIAKINRPVRTRKKAAAGYKLKVLEEAQALLKADVELAKEKEGGR